MLKRVLLLKPWGDMPKGAVVEVDADRAAKLIADGIGMDEEKALLTGDPTARKPKGIKRA